MAWKVKGPTNLLQSIVVANYNTLMEFVRRLSEVTRRVVVGDWRLNNLSGSQVGEFFTHAAHQIPLRCVTAAFKAFSANNHDYNDNHINSTSLTMIAKSLSYRCTADFVPLFKRVTKPSDFLPEFYFRLARSFIIHVDCAHSLSIFSREHTISCPMRTFHNPFCRLYTLFDFFVDCGYSMIMSTTHARLSLWSRAHLNLYLRVRAHLDLSLGLHTFLDLSFRLSTIVYLSQVCSLVDHPCQLRMLLLPLMSLLHAPWLFLSSTHAVLSPMSIAHILLLLFYTLSVIYFVECTPLLDLSYRPHTLTNLYFWVRTNLDLLSSVRFSSFLFSDAHPTGQGSHDKLRAKHTPM